MLFPEVSNMFAIDKENFGSFVAQLRKEQGLTQREVAERLYVSDKAVSKWETGMSIPDTALLIPLSELLGVTVTELLLCRRQPDSEKMDPQAVEDVVKAAIAYPGGKPQRVWRSSGWWKLGYALCLLLGAVGLLLGIRLNAPVENAGTAVLLGAIFGAWFCFFAKQELPRFYDENVINGMMDGPFRMNIPGVRFSNRNWPHIITVGRVWSCVIMAGMPAVSLLISLLWPEIWAQYQLAIFLTATLAGLFVPMYVVGRRYQ